VSASPPAELPLPRFLWLATLLECVVVAWAGILLFFMPALGRRIWAYSAPPFSSRFVGAVYLAALVPLLIVAVSRRWAPGRVVLLMIFTFTTTIMIVMFFYSASFAWNRVQTYGFWGLYVALPANSAVFLYRYRRLLRTGIASDRVLLAAALLVGLYGAGLLIAPRASTSFWPWAVAGFQGRLYAAAFLASAVGLVFATPAGHPSERAAVGAWLCALGVAVILGLLLGDATAATGHGVDLGAAGTWGFIVLNVALALLGAQMLSSPVAKGAAPS
jgi:hypothetical protein